MKNSQKAFEKWWKKGDGVNISLADPNKYHAFSKAAWLAAIEFSAKVCEKIEQETWVKYKEEGCNPHQEGKSDGAGVCANEIRKQGLL